MKEDVFKYKLLAFVTMVKLTRDNSILQHDKETNEQVYKTMGISYVSFLKYKKYLINNGLTKKVGPNLVIVKMKNVLTFLNEGEVNTKNLRFNKHLFFFKKYQHTSITFKELFNTIISGVVLKNLNQQIFNRDKTIAQLAAYKNSSNRNKATGQLIKALSKKAARYNISTDELVKRTEVSDFKYIVTGKSHISKLTGLSTAASSALLRRMHNSGIIDRKIINYPLKHIPITTPLEVVKEMYPKGVIYISKRYNMFFLSKGSQIEKTKKFETCFNYGSSKKSPVALL
jgi:hypothetical protein